MLQAMGEHLLFMLFFSNLRLLSLIMYISLNLVSLFWKQDMLYLDNLEASVVILRTLSDEWKEHSAKHPTRDTLRETLQSFKQKVNFL